MMTVKIKDKWLWIKEDELWIDRWNICGINNKVRKLEKNIADQDTDTVLFMEVMEYELH